MSSRSGWGLVVGDSIGLGLLRPLARVELRPLSLGVSKWLLMEYVMVLYMGKWDAEIVPRSLARTIAATGMGNKPTNHFTRLRQSRDGYP